MRSLLTRSLEQFGDKFYVKHAPMRSQEGWFILILLYYYRIANIQKRIPKSSF